MEAGEGREAGQEARRRLQGADPEGRKKAQQEGKRQALAAAWPHGRLQQSEKEREAAQVARGEDLVGAE